MSRPALVFSILMTIALGIPAGVLADQPRADRVVYHLDDAANASWGMMLAGGHLDLDKDAHIVFVAYGPGIDFLLDGAEDRKGNPYNIRVESLQERGVEFRVCEQTLKFRKIDKDQLLDGVTLVPSGAYEIARLQNQEGYAYFRP